MSNLTPEEEHQSNLSTTETLHLSDDPNNAENAPTAKKRARKATSKKGAKKAAKKTSATKEALGIKNARKKVVRKKVAKKAATPEANSDKTVQTPLTKEEQTPTSTATSIPPLNENTPRPQKKRPKQKIAAKKQTHNKQDQPEQNNSQQKSEQHQTEAAQAPQEQEASKQQYKPKRKKYEVTGDPVAIAGVLEVAPKGFGFIRLQEKDWEQSRTDAFVPPDMIRTHGLRHASWIEGFYQEGKRGQQLTSIATVNGKAIEDAKKCPHFEELKAVNPNKRISLETDSNTFSNRIIDIMAPIGRGQRGLIVSPPRSGKTTVLIDMAQALLENHKYTMKLIVLLIDERPEEVTDFKRRLPNVEIFASSNDSGARSHCRLAELCIERAKRLVEAGEHVFVMMDSITRLARAYNFNMSNSKQSKGKGYQSGGLVAGSMEIPRKLFAAARNTRTAGSLTIIATALVQTNSRADEAVFQEFKGTGNMELVLDRRLAEKYIFPAVDIFKSGTRREELLIPEVAMEKVHLIRRGLAGHRNDQAMESLLKFFQRFQNNAQMLLEIKNRR